MHTLHHSRHHYSHHQSSFQYLVLGLMIMTAILTFMRTNGDGIKQLQVGLVASISYVVWGMYHHLHTGDLHWKIVVEYSSIALFGIVLLWMVLALFS